MTVFTRALAVYHDQGCQTDPRGVQSLQPRSLGSGVWPRVYYRVFRWGVMTKHAEEEKDARG